MAGDHQAGPDLLDLLPGAARALRAAAHEERGQARVPAGRQRARGDDPGRRTDHAPDRAAHPGSHGDGGRGRDRRRRRHEVSADERVNRRMFLESAGASVAAAAIDGPRIAKRTETGTGTGTETGATDDRAYWVTVAR